MPRALAPWCLCPANVDVRFVSLLSEKHECGVARHPSIECAVIIGSETSQAAVRCSTI